jgi:hypothetical protein
LTLFLFTKITVIYKKGTFCLTCLKQCAKNLSKGYDIQAKQRKRKFLELAQICYDFGAPEAKQRDVRALSEAGEELEVEKLTILTWDEGGEIKYRKAKIRLIPLWKQLLDG